MLVLTAWAAFGHAGERSGDLLLNEPFIEQRLGFVDDVHAAPAVTLGDVMFDVPGSVLRAMLASVPHGVVYPSERYFYYRFDLGPRGVSGNLRFTDIEDGVLHMGYFDIYDSREVRARSFTEADGVAIEALPATAAGRPAYRVTFDGVSAVFELATEFLRVESDIGLAAGEAVVSGTLDESGTPLALVWNAGVRSFFFLLPPDARRGLVLAYDDRADVWLDPASRFVYWMPEAGGRCVLIGVWAENVRGNTWFDGPFDQVPPRLAIREMIHTAYPYTRARGGIDEHGNFVGQPGHRVAISPYQEYETLASMRGFIERTLRERPVDGPELWAALCYESKRDFVPPEARTGAPTLGDRLRDRAVPAYAKQGWPANHEVAASRAWPSEHLASVSGTWPANSGPDGQPLD